MSKADEKPTPDEQDGARIARLLERQREVAAHAQERAASLDEPGGNALAALLNAHKDAAWTAGQLDRTGAPAPELEAAHNASDAVQDAWRAPLAVS